MFDAVTLRYAAAAIMLSLLIRRHALSLIATLMLLLLLDATDAA